MASKAVRADKRARPPRVSAYTSQFLKDWRRINDAGRSDLARAKRVMLLLLAADAPLPAEYKDHALEGNWRGYRDCHIHGDFLLIYKIEGKADDERIVFTRLGTHSELF